MICIRLLEQVTKHQFIFLSKRYPYHGLQDAISKFLDLSGPSIQVGVSAREFLPMISGNCLIFCRKLSDFLQAY